MLEISIKNKKLIWDKAIYIKELEVRDHLLSFYYLVL